MRLYGTPRHFVITCHLLSIIFINNLEQVPVEDKPTTTQRGRKRVTCRGVLGIRPGDS